MITRDIFRATFVLPLCAIFFLTACSDNPASHDDDHEDHADAHGAELIVGNSVVYRVLEGEVSCDTAPCGISTVVGEATEVQVRFIDDDGDEVHEEDLEEGFTMTFSVNPPGVAVVEPVGDWGLRVTGVIAGSSVMQIQLNHEGHPDFITPPLENDGAIVIEVGSE